MGWFHGITSPGSPLSPAAELGRQEQEQQPVSVVYATPHGIQGTKFTGNRVLRLMTLVSTPHLKSFPKFCLPFVVAVSCSGILPRAPQLSRCWTQHHLPTDLPCPDVVS